jgi:uncharacterized membrane protein HdeD (DUF308 family)
MTVDQSNQPIGTAWWLLLLEGAAAIVVGLLLLTSPGASTVIIVQILGIYWLIAGLFALVSIFLDSDDWGWKLLRGVIGIIAGLLIIQHPLWSALILPASAALLLGFGGLIIGVVNLIQALRGGEWGIGILGVISIGFGFLLVANPVLGAISLPFVLGIFGVVGGIVAVIQAFRRR